MTEKEAWAEIQKAYAGFNDKSSSCEIEDAWGLCHWVDYHYAMVHLTPALRDRMRTKISRELGREIRLAPFDLEGAKLRAKLCRRWARELDEKRVNKKRAKR